jgi:hypothetical protein
VSRDERYGTRDLTFSRWHRYALPDRVTAIDLDMIEYCRRCRMPLCLIETARDVGQEAKPTLVMERLATVANVVAVCILYTPSGECCCRSGSRDADCHHGIEKVRFRRVHPIDEPFDTWQSWELAAWLTSLHDNHEAIACRLRRAS